MTPYDILLDPVTICITGLYVALILTEALFPARLLPEVGLWKITGILSFYLFLFLSSYLPYWYSELLPSMQLIDLTGMNVAMAALIGVLLYELVLYLWHRSMHKSTLLWRTFHQMHHSAERLDTYGAFYFSPFDMIGFTLIGTLCFSFILGLPPQAITIFLLVTNFFNIFQHANIKTPVWLGYIIQRPESHAVHHAKGVHAFNYSDLPLFDILFGTFRNPKKYVRETGFYVGASSRIIDMLSFKDVSQKENHNKYNNSNKHMNKIAILIGAFLLMQEAQSQENLNTNFGIGGQVGQHQSDFGIGLNVTSPYFGNKKMAVRLKGNLMWNQHIGEDYEAVWTSYSNLSLGIVQSVGEIAGFMRIYGEGGAIYLFPSSEFSSKSLVFGGYGLFGFEFFFDKHLNYFLEAGGVGTGAREDEITGKPVYSNGFLVNVGVRAQF